MYDLRLDKLKYWLEVFFDDANFTINKASDDASFRRYFRIERSNLSFIAMDAPPEKENSKLFIDIANLLRHNHVHAPKIISTDLAQGFLLIEDLGNITFLQALNSQSKLDLYKLAIDELIKIQQIDLGDYPLNKYNKNLLNAELELLIDWYLPKNTSQQSLDKLHQLFDQLVQNSLNSPQVFVHRDYHCRNLMITNSNISVIDFQDAVIGSNTYDLASLLKDAYFELGQHDLTTLLGYYHTQTNNTNSIDEFEKQFDLMGLQRHLKILGIFKRLALRDGKNQYLDNIPLVKKYTLQMAYKYPEFAFLKALL
jgi:aminoglycoside/choline kinase family phosphotransferase